MKNINKALRNGEIVIGTHAVISDPCVVELLGYVGWDFVMINCDQGTASAFGRDLENMIRACYAADVAPVVKITRNDPGMIMKSLNFGAQVVCVPNVESKEELITAMAAAKFPPQGERDAAPMLRVTKYSVMPWDEFYPHANEEVTLWPLIENLPGIKNMEEILSVKGLEVVSLGEFDLQVREGGAGNANAVAKVNKHFEKLIALCKKNGLIPMRTVTTVEATKAAIGMGCRCIIFASDIYRMALRERAQVKELSQAIEGWR